MVRLLVLIAVTWATPALAKPTVAVAPIGGDSDEEVTEVIIEVLDNSSKVVKPKAVVKSIGKLGIAGELDAKDAAKLQKALKADAVVQGRVRKDGKNRKLKMTVFVKGKKPGVFSVEFKKAKSEKFKEALQEALAKRLEDVKSEEDEEEDKRKKKQREEDEEKEREREKKRVAQEEEDKRKKKQRDDDEEETKKKKKKKKGDDEEKRVASAEEDDGEKKVRKKKRRGDDDETEVAVRGTMLRIDAGTSFGVRRLTYSAADGPPPLGTFGYGARIEAEIYPFASKGGGAGGLGLHGEYDKTFGLTIEVPAGGSAPIDQQHLSIGARYRIGTTKTFTMGVDLMKRKYVADRSQLTQPADLDAPDTNYTAVGPNAGVRVPAGAKAAVFGTFTAMLILDTGPIQGNDSFGAATVFGGELAGGVDISISNSIMLRLAGELTQINFKFDGTGSQTMLRGITAATDRSFGMAATLAMTMN